MTRANAFEEAARERVLQAMWDAHRVHIGHQPGPMPPTRTDSRAFYSALLDAALSALAVPESQPKETEHD